MFHYSDKYTTDCQNNAVVGVHVSATAFPGVHVNSRGLSVCGRCTVGSITAGGFLHRRNSVKKITTSALSESMTCSLCIVLHVCMHYSIYI